MGTRCYCTVLLFLFVWSETVVTHEEEGTYGYGHRHLNIYDAVSIARVEAEREVSAVLREENDMVNEQKMNRKRRPFDPNAFQMVADLKGGSLYTKGLETIARVQLKIFRKLIDSKAYPVSEIEQVSTLRSPGQDKSHNVEAAFFPNKAPTDPFLPTVCPTGPQTINCDDPRYIKYRTIDGSCNNIWNPHWGKSFMPLLRLISPAYGDGVGSFRRAKSGNELPSARLVSRVIHEDSNKPAMTTMNLMTFGQFLDHDYDRSPVSKMQTTDENGMPQVEDVPCGDDGCASAEMHPDNPAYAECMPVTIPPNDNIFKTKKCLKFVRSSAAPRDKCVLGPREQLNQITSYLDLSLVYGNTDEDALELRDPDTSRGKLLAIKNPTAPSIMHGALKGLLPQDDVKACREVDDTIKCFKAGDGRLNEHIGLIAYHVYFMREHNRIEEELHQINPFWQGEQLYQEARKINIAQWQHIVYNEYLPVILGPKIMQKYDLFVRRGTDYYYGYDPQVNAGVSNVFATAAFRFGHSQVGAKLRRVWANHTIIKDHHFSKVFRRPALIYKYEEGTCDSIMLGACDQESEAADKHMSVEVNGHMFSENPPAGEGTDLGMLNNNRGRDHGLPGYNQYRELCGGNRALTFEDFSNDPVFPEFNIDPKTVQQFKMIYEHPDDVDLFAAAMSEKNLKGACVGPTFACILADQFNRTRTGDRFWFENYGVFNEEQLREIRKVRLSNIFCDNAEVGGIETIQPLTMILPWEQLLELRRLKVKEGYDIAEMYHGLGKDLPFSFSKDNRRVHCSKLPRMNLWKWLDVGAGPGSLFNSPFQNDAVQASIKDKVKGANVGSNVKRKGRNKRQKGKARANKTRPPRRRG